MVHRIINKLLSTNTYIYVLENKDCIIIDPGSDFEEINTFIITHQLNPKAILATHGHFDHIASITKLKAIYNATFYLHHKDLKTVKLSNFLMKMFSLKGKIDIPVADILITENNFILEIDTLKIEFLNTPGHTAGSCVIKIGSNIFTGDTLFYSKLSSSKIPNDNAKILAESEDLIRSTFDGNNIIYPGHGDFGLLKNLP